MDFEQLGPYKIGARLGKGGMGSVYRGENTETGEAAAIKALAPQLATSEGFRERFEAEIESLKTLMHEGIVRLYGYGEEAGTLFYAMELVDGRSLEEELRAGRRFDWREVVDIAIQVCRALKHAHDHGIIHRDIKPANILLDKNEKVKLADFGIARLFGSNQLTMAGGVLGTADYMSPEQAEGRPVTERCDQYSLGCVMYALLAGRPPFQAKSLPEMLQLQRFAEPEPVRRYASQTPEHLEHCVSQLLKKEASDRFPNAMVLARHLEAMRRALSRPFDHSQPEPGGDASIPSDRERTPLPIELAVTKADAGAARDDSFDVDESLDMAPLPTALREAATVDSVAADPTKSTFDNGTSSGDHFTTVDAQRGQSGQVLSPSVVTAAAGLLALLAVLGYTIYQMAKPYDADALYAKVHAQSETLSVDELRAHAASIDEFVQRFPNDRRAPAMVEYQEELELDRQQRRFATMVKGRGQEKGLLTIERLYLAALRKAELTPGAAADELEHLLALFAQAADDETDDSDRERTTVCLALARRQLESLQDAIERQTEADLATLDAQLGKAEALRESQPNEAAAMCRAVIELYREKPWAEDAVERAARLLESWQEPR